jgi:6,7-dimethyl-8-ribityllumazine synthase
MPQEIGGTLVGIPDDAELAIVASRFNHFVVDRLVEGAIGALGQLGVGPSRLTVVQVPGAWELPWAVRRLCRTGRFAAVVAVGAVIRGSTPHFDYVAGEASRGCAAAMAETGVPVGFGLLTTDTIEQAIERAGTKAGNKGAEAAMVAAEMITLGRALEDAGL